MAAQEKRAAKRTNLDYEETFTAVIGPQKTNFTLHAQTATAKSKFFRVAIKGDFKEAKKRKVSLPDVDVNDFRIYVQWVYTGQVVVMNAADIDPVEKKSGGIRYTSLARLYVLADSLDDMAMRNTVIDELVDLYGQTNTYPAFECLDVAYNHTPDGAALRRLMVDI